MYLLKDDYTYFEVCSFCGQRLPYAYVGPCIYCGGPLNKLGSNKVVTENQPESTLNSYDYVINSYNHVSRTYEWSFYFKDRTARKVFICEYELRMTTDPEKFMLDKLCKETGLDQLVISNIFKNSEKYNPYVPSMSGL